MLNDNKYKIAINIKLITDNVKYVLVTCLMNDNNKR